MLESYEFFVSKHGEIVLWSILENWERFRGLRSSATLTLEERWIRFVRETEPSNALLSMAA